MRSGKKIKATPEIGPKKKSSECQSVVAKQDFSNKSTTKKAVFLRMKCAMCGCMCAWIFQDYASVQPFTWFHKTPDY